MKAQQKSKSPWKGLGMGALGLGLACAACCLAPLAAVFAASSVGVGAGLAGLLSPGLVFAGILVGLLALFAVWWSRKNACCSSPGAGCGDTRCGIPNPEAGAKGVRGFHPSCRLTPEGQADRIEALQSGLFRAMDSVLAEPGSLKLRFADTPENVAELIDFIRFERDCCTAVHFGLGWAPEGGPVILEMKGPQDWLSGLQDVAQGAHGGAGRGLKVGAFRPVRKGAPESSL